MKRFMIAAGIIFAIGMMSLSAKNSDVAPEIKVASYNIRQANAHDSIAGNGWGQRMPYLADLIRYNDFQIFGTQEGFSFMLDSLENHLPGYRYIGVGREDGRKAGEYSAIFYQTDLFDLLDSGNFWLSENPERPGLGWDAVCVRVCTWGKFRHRPSGREFLFMNLHMDHVGKKARTEAAKLVKKRIGEIAGNLPAIVTGDFNVDQTSPAYETMVSNGDMVDSYEIAEIRFAPNGTFNSYETDGFSTSRIDHVFLTPGIRALRYGILTDTYRIPKEHPEEVKLQNAPAEIKSSRYIARTPSDHFPVAVTILLPEK